MTNKKKYTIKDVIEILENKFFNTLKPIDYGKAIQTAAESYVELKVNEISEDNLIIDVTENDELIQKYEYINNGPGFDRLLLKNNLRLQIKFRQVEGLTPYSRQTHFSNTRRHSKKNKGNGDSTGNIVYRCDEFDYVLVILCHIKGKVRTKFDKWSFSLIPAYELVDVNNIEYCSPNISSDKLYKYKLDNIYMLTEKLKTL
jgi:hypothetical protein